MEAQEHNFPYDELMNNQESSSIRLSNRTNQHVAFKVTTSNPKKYSVLPCSGIILPGSSFDVIVTMIGPKPLPTEGKCLSKFSIKTVVWNLFDKKAGFPIQELKSGVIYIFPSQVPSPVVEKYSECSSFASQNTNSNSPEMAARKVLDIQPTELKFDFELNKELCCLLQLSNVTEDRVFFNVKTTNRNKYCVQPNMGIVLPLSTCDIIVRMKAQNEIPHDMHCKDKFLIQSIVGNPATKTAKNVTPEMFDEKERFVEEFKLGVVYTTIPLLSDQQPSNSETLSEAHSYVEVPSEVLQRGSSNNPEELKRNWSSELGDLFMKSIISGLLGIIFWYLLMKIVPLIWSLSIVVMMLVVKMIQNLVSNSVEDWIVKSLGYVVIHFMAVVFGRKVNASET